MELRLNKYSLIIILFLGITFLDIYAQVYWEKLIDSDITSHVYSLKIDSSNNIYAASINGLFVISNTGTSWERL